MKLSTSTVATLNQALDHYDTLLRSEYRVNEPGEASSLAMSLTAIDQARREVGRAAMDSGPDVLLQDDVWVCEYVHVPCPECYDAGSAAINIAKATGSTGGFHSDTGNHGAAVTRRHRCVKAIGIARCPAAATDGSTLCPTHQADHDALIREGAGR